MHVMLLYVGRPIQLGVEWTILRIDEHINTVLQRK